MAEEDQLPMNPEDGAETDDWQRSTSGYERGDALKEGPWVKIKRTGSTEAGAEATAMALEVARKRGLGQYDWAFDFFGSNARGQIRGVPIPLNQATKGSCLVRWFEGKGSPRASWHMGGVFKDFKGLRPKSEVRCRVTIATGPDGLPVLVIPIKAALSTQSSSRSGGGETPGSQAAAGEGPKE